MHLTPQERDKLLIFAAGLVAERRLARHNHELLPLCFTTYWVSLSGMPLHLPGKQKPR